MMRPERLVAELFLSNPPTYLYGSHLERALFTILDLPFVISLLIKDGAKTFNAML